MSSPNTAADERRGRVDLIRCDGVGRSRLSGMTLGGFMEHQTMADRVAVRNRSSLVLIGPIAGVAMAGFYFGLTSHPNIEPVVKPAMAMVLVLAGMLLLFPLAAFGPRNDYERKSRIRISAAGAGQIVFGVAQLIPSPAFSHTLAGSSILFMVAAFRGIPSRFFAARV